MSEDRRFGFDFSDVSFSPQRDPGLDNYDRSPTTRPVSRRIGRGFAGETNDESRSIAIRA